MGGNIPIILLGNSLSEDSGFAIHSKVLEILEIHVQRSQPKSFNLLQLREIEIANPRRARWRAWFCTWCLWIIVVMESTLSLQFMTMATFQGTTEKHREPFRRFHR